MCLSDSEYYKDKLNTRREGLLSKGAGVVIFLVRVNIGGEVGTSSLIILIPRAYPMP